MESEDDAGRLSEQQGGTQEAHGRAVVHGGVGDVEGETGDNVVHQDAEVITQEGARDTKLPCGGNDEKVAKTQEGIGGVGDQGTLEGRVRGLVTQGALVEEVADEAETEDGGSKGVASGLGVAAERAGDELVAVFCR